MKKGIKHKNQQPVLESIITSGAPGELQLLEVHRQFTPGQQLVLQSVHNHLD